MVFEPAACTTQGELKLTDLRSEVGGSEDFSENLKVKNKFLIDVYVEMNPPSRHNRSRSSNTDDHADSLSARNAIDFTLDAG